ncbi:MULTISPECIES: hypothetical protein [Burkholderiaceae]|uniref:hypothetical protein n=1 Tax=Burkholderiaceae TaxID=119060 RepID=UPI0015F8E1C1|nr:MULTISPECIES: hypothetical protein [Burkholderiaceae]MBA9902257.1 hypothetical protein [Burkholderia cepacia]MBA9949152.1 hypothetical protein [Burkholderia cepacia]MBA9979461.1 hypothetical protein [Burkholderia cepacia]MBA9998300.1 hypothetical protein [Burkholderia cepacia]MBB0006240.1 hypothetical protein [Burkholderia cepacia]
MSKYVAGFIAGLVFSATAGVTIGAFAATNGTAGNPVCTEGEMPYQHVGTDSQVKIEFREFHGGKDVATYAHMQGIDMSGIEPAVKKVRVRVCVEPASDATAPAAAK